MTVKTPLVFAGQRVGIMGGTFNPAHAGHGIVAETAAKRLLLDQLWIVVTPGNPLKANGGLPPLQERMRDARTFAKQPRMKVTSFEAELGTPYTAAMLAFLKRRHPGVHFVWVMGADNLASFDRWQYWQSIAAAFPIAVVDRPGWRLKALSAHAGAMLGEHRVPEQRAAGLALMRPPAWTLLTTRLSSLSSTAIRAGRSNVA